MKGSERAQAILEEGGYTCVFEKDGERIVSRERGIRPLIRLLDEKRDVRGRAAADKIVGRAAAFLYVRLGISCLYAEVLSEGGLAVLQKYKIPVRYGTLAGQIINRSGTDICPMEKAVAATEDPAEAEAVLRAKLAQMP